MPFASVWLIGIALKTVTTNPKTATERYHATCKVRLKLENARKLKPAVYFDCEATKGGQSLGTQLLARSGDAAVYGSTDAFYIDTDGLRCE